MVAVGTVPISPVAYLCNGPPRVRPRTSRLEVSPGLAVAPQPVCPCSECWSLGALLPAALAPGLAGVSRLTFQLPHPLAGITLRCGFYTISQSCPEGINPQGPTAVTCLVTQPSLAACSRLTSHFLTGGTWGPLPGKLPPLESWAQGLPLDKPPL